jgi:EAL domain-containing protein (putative c-di-GMP-specific phosphodiesterase class I)
MRWGEAISEILDWRLGLRRVLRRRAGRSAFWLHATLQAGHPMSADPIAEGIETADQHEFLVDLGCDLGQGFLLGRPSDSAGAAELVRQAAT